MGNIIESSFETSAWLKNPHLQTILPPLLRVVDTTGCYTEQLSLPGGDVLNLTWVGDKGPIVIILHGLEGSADSQYVKGMFRKLQALGWRGVLVHYRSCSHASDQLSPGCHAGYTADLNYLYQQLTERYPATPIAVVGYSLGANVMLKWLGEQGRVADLFAAVAVSVPFRLSRVADTIQASAWLYQRMFMYYLRRSFDGVVLQQMVGLSKQAFYNINTFRDFDNLITARLHGFQDAEDYYSKASCYPYLKQIANPTLIIHAIDDPLITPDIVPAIEDLSDSVTIELSQYGGHVGFIRASNFLKLDYWLESRIIRYLKDIL